MTNKTTEPAALAGIEPVAKIVFDNTGLYLLKGAPDNLPQGTKLYSAATVEKLTADRDNMSSLFETMRLRWIGCNDLLDTMTQERNEARSDAAYYEHNRNIMNGEWGKVKEQLAASQAREQQLREALEEANALNLNWVSVAEPDMLEHLSEYKTVIKMGTIALTLPQDDTALRQWGAKLLREMADLIVARYFAHDATNALRHKADELETVK